MLNELLKVVLSISISGSVIAVLLITLRPLIHNKLSEKWYYYIWLIVMARLVIPFGLPINVVGNIVNYIPDISSVIERGEVYEPIYPMYTDTVINVHTEASSVQNNIAPDDVSARQKANTDYLSFLPVIGIIWLVTGIVIFICKLLSYCRFTRFIKANSKVISDDIILDICYDVCQMLGLKKEIPILSSKASSPMLIGLINPIIVLPETQIQNPVHLKYIFMHELTHYKRFDILYKWLMQIILCVHWFNPIVHLVGKEINKSCEMSCDESVIKSLTPKEQRIYGDTLLHSFEITSGYNNPVVSLTLTENSKLMKKRLNAIMRFRKKSTLAACISVILTVILCTGSMFSKISAESPYKTVSGTNTENTASPLLASKNMFQNIQPIANTAVGAHSNNGKWASAAGIEAATYKKQLDEKISWVENLYNEKKESFMLYETISEKESTNVLGIKYMYENSPVYKDMANVEDTFRLLPYDSQFSRLGSNKYYERRVFYADEPSVLVLNVFYELSEGRLALYVVNPDGKISLGMNDLTDYYSNNVVLSLDIGLWSIITVSESETGVIKGTQKIEGNIVSLENIAVPIDIPKLQPNETIKYGPFLLNENEICSVDIESWKGGGNIFIADKKEDGNFDNLVIIKSTPKGYTFLADESTYYYISIGNGGEKEITDIKGKITINLLSNNTAQKDGTDDTSKGNPPVTKSDYDDAEAVNSNSAEYIVEKLSKEQPPDGLKAWIEECDKKKDLYVMEKNNKWYIYCNITASDYAVDIDNISEQDGIVVNLSGGKGKDGVWNNDNYVFMSVPSYKNNIRVFYKDKSVQFTDDNKTITEPSGFDDDKTVLEYYNKKGFSTDGYYENTNGNGKSLSFTNFTGSRQIFELNYQKPTTVSFRITADVSGEYKVIIITESNEILMKASSYNNQSAVKPIKLPNGSTKVVLIGEKATGTCNISLEIENENTAIDLKNKNTYNISESGSFKAEDGQTLSLTVASSIKGGTVDLFLFDPKGKEQRITIGATGFTQEIKLSKGVWQYNCSGIFRYGGSLHIKGLIISQD